jgi:hypothetical protein
MIPEFNGRIQLKQALSWAFEHLPAVNMLERRSEIC